MEIKSGFITNPVFFCFVEGLMDVREQRADVRTFNCCISGYSNRIRIESQLYISRRPGGDI